MDRNNKERIDGKKVERGENRVQVQADSPEICLSLLSRKYRDWDSETRDFPVVFTSSKDSVRPLD